MKKSDAAKRQGLKSMSKRRSGEKSSKRLGKIIPRDSKNEAAATMIKIVIATAPSSYISTLYQRERAVTLQQAAAQDHQQEDLAPRYPDQSPLLNPCLYYYCRCHPWCCCHLCQLLDLHL